VVCLRIMLSILGIVLVLVLVFVLCAVINESERGEGRVGGLTLWWLASVDLTSLVRWLRP
jgi:hypothetical protein